MNAASLDALIARLEADLEAARHTRTLLLDADTPRVRPKPRKARKARRQSSAARTARRAPVAVAAADRPGPKGDGWWKHSPSAPGECDKRLYGGCKGPVHERVCGEDECGYVARRCDAHGGKQGTGQQIGAHTGRHRAERRQRTLGDGAAGVG